MAETSRNPESKMSAMESVTEGQSQPLSPLKKKQIGTTKAIQQEAWLGRKLAMRRALTHSPVGIGERPTKLRETFGPLQLPLLRKPAQQFLQLEEKDFITPKLELDKKRPLFISEQKKHTSELMQKFSVKEPPSQDQETEIRSRATNLREKFGRLRRRGLSEAGQESLQLKEQKDFLTTHKLELDKKRLLVISEQKGYTSGSVLRVKRQALWSENRLVALKRELLREETLLSKLEENRLTSLQGRSKSDDNSSRYEILNALTELMQVQEDWPHFPFWHRILDFSDCQSLVCYEILVYAETFLFLLESQVCKGKQAIKSTDQHSRVDSLRQVVDAQQELLNMQKMTYQKMTGTKQEKKTPGQGESEEGKKKLLQRMSVIKQEEGTLGQAETVEGIKQSADTSKQLELILEQTRVLTEIEREGLYRTSTDQKIFSLISSSFETTFDAMLLQTNSSTLMLEHLMETFEELLCHFEQMLVAIHDSRHINWWVVKVNSKLMRALHPIVREIRTRGELLQKFSVKKPPSQDQETELEEDGRTSLLTSAEELAKLQSQEQQDSDIGQETATKQSKHSDAATVVRFGAFGTIARQPNSMTLEVLACRDTEEAIEEMFKYCQNNCLQILDFSGHQMKLDSPTDLCLVVKTLGKKWVLLDSTKQTVSKEQLTEGFFGKSKWQFQTRQDEEDARSPARDELLCEIEIKPNEESIAYSEVNTVQLSVDFASLVDFPTCESNPETVTYKKEDTPTQTHLDKLLLDYKELAEELGEEFIKENTMQLENFAIGYFNEEGGTLSLNSHKVQLYIPRGALPSDRKEQVYIYVDPSEQLEDGNDSLSPVVRCGPPGLKFTESVVLSFPHSADSSADLSALICEGTKGCPSDWQPLEDVLISFNENKAILLVDHFTRFGVGYKSRKIHIAAASDYVPSSGGCTVRLCVFNKSPRDLDDFAGKTKKADLVRHKGHVYVGIRNVSNGYEVRPKARKVFHWQQVWTVFKNTTTFYLISSASTFSIPICEVNCSQEALHNNQPWKGFDVSMKVTPGSTSPSELNRVCKENATCPNKPAQLAVGPECSPSTRPSDQESMKRKFAKNVLGDYGGLSSTGVSKLCELLEANREGESYWRALATDLFGPSERLIQKAQLKPNPAKEVLKVYFATKIEDEDAVENLTHVFRRLGFDEDVIRSTEEADTVSENSENDASKGNVALPTELPSKAPFCAQSDSVSSRKSTDHEKLLRQIASELGEEWERLATTLGVSSSKIFQLKENNRGKIGDAMFQMLLCWHQGGGQLADLVSALDDVGRNDLANKLQDVANNTQALQSTRSSHGPRHTQKAYKQGFTDGKERGGVSHTLEGASCQVC
ncbi:uncharacterized protein LOC110983490 isoform X2 [Acanthaster planci]|uniref:Netrin receptor UNC5 n=1 Tax=Acanthaster planci TaxID=133434 RepID=A0A8B7YYQ7_ACAPL|nr:uncharacterized protein LOC110983490 isoform X2 [Acanthaster planci]